MDPARDWSEFMKADVMCPHSQSLALTRTGDYVQLVRPKLALLVLVTVAAGWLLAATNGASFVSLIHALIGTSLLFAGASALNQWLERDSDALMQRTSNRPLPAARLHSSEVLALGSTLSAVGLADLLTARQLPGAGLGLFALISYVLVYTPLKRRTTLNTLIGAIAGAVPPLIGWAAARGRLDVGALVLFVIVFLWQVPHFLAIAWIYRDEYRAAGLRMLPVSDPEGVQTGRQMLRYTVVLIIASIMPCALGLGSWMSALGAAVLGGVLLYAAVVFTHTPTKQQARQVFRASLAFLPTLFLLFVLDSLLNGSWL
jgi:protoheme IX farnesyltransferase